MTDKLIEDFLNKVTLSPEELKFVKHDRTIPWPLRARFINMTRRYQRKMGRM